MSMPKIIKLPDLGEIWVGNFNKVKKLPNSFEDPRSITEDDYILETDIPELKMTPPSSTLQYMTLEYPKE